MINNPLVILSLLLWLATLAAFFFYLRGHSNRQKKTINDYLSERDKTFFELRKSEERYNKLISHMNEGLIFTDENDHIRFANKCACNILKTSAGNIIGRSIFDFVLSPGDSRKLGLPYELKRPGCSHREEVQLVRLNGEMFWASLNISYIDKLKDDMPGAIIIMMDISEQKLAAEKLHNITLNLNQRVKQLDCLFDISDAMNIPGITVKEILKKTLEFIPLGLSFSHDAWAEIILNDTRYLSDNFKESNLTYSVPIKGKEQKLGTLRVGYRENSLFTGSDVFHVNEKILIKNIAEKLAQLVERKELETSLESGLEKLNELKKMAHIGDWELDLVQKRASFSPRFFEVMGVLPEHRDGYNYESVMQQILPEDRPEIEALLQRLLSGKVKDLARAYRFMTHKGQLRSIFGQGKAIYDKNGKAVQIIGTVQDMTAQLQLFQKLKEKSL